MILLLVTHEIVNNRRNRSIMNQGIISKLIGNLETGCAQLGHMTISFSLMLKVEVGCSSFSVNQLKCDFGG